MFYILFMFTIYNKYLLTNNFSIAEIMASAGLRHAGGSDDNISDDENTPLTQDIYGGRLEYLH